MQRTMNDKVILDLVLKGKWYDMIERGGKLEEYREIKPYWDRRLFSRPYPRPLPQGLHEEVNDLHNPRRDTQGLRLRRLLGRTVKQASVHNTYWNKSG